VLFRSDGIGMTEMLHIFLSNRAGQVRPGVADPPPLAGDAQQVLGHGQAHQLRVVQGRLAAGPAITRPAPSAGSTRSVRST